MIVVTFSIGAPTTKARTKCVDAPKCTNDGAIVAAQHEQKGWGTAHKAPANEPVTP
jgi:hypothetical protein